MHVLERSSAESTRMSTENSGLQYLPMWADKKRQKRFKKIRKMAEKKRAKQKRGLALVEFLIISF